MAKVWVLDTETKGTGAEVVPLEKALERKRSAPRAEAASALRRRPRHRVERPAEPIEVAPEPRRFRVVNVLSREIDAGVRETVDALRQVGSLVDVRIDVRDPATGGWRPLNAGEKRTLWGFR